MTFNKKNVIARDSVNKESKSRGNLLITASVFILSILLSSNVFAQTPDFDKLKERFESGKVFKASYIHEFVDSYTGEVNVSEGQIWIEQNGYKLESEDQVLVVDGEISRVYEAGRNRLIVSEYDPETDDFAPSRMLNGVDSTYEVSEEKLDYGTRINLISNDDFAVFSKVEIIIDRQQRPIEITAYDISENVIVTMFEEGSFVEMDDSIFTLDVPDDAEVVDMRY